MGFSHPLQTLAFLFLCTSTTDGLGAAPPIPKQETLAREQRLLREPLALAEGSSDRKARGASDIADIISNMNFYHMILVPLAVLTIALAVLTRPKSSESQSPEFSRFQWHYLIIWYIAVAADWLQGPYVYALYESYQYSSAEIGQLFVAGFGASMVMGTFVGALADSFGRKRTCMLYCVLYIVSCCTKHFTNYWILMFGRVTGGIATSVLFSCFETWMVSEHLSRYKFSDGLLHYMFSMMFFGMYAIAIVSGLVAESIVAAYPMRDWFDGAKLGGYLCPFDLAIVLLLICLARLATSWEENYGAADDGGSSFGSAFTCLFSDWRLALVGVIVTGFEGSMYAFVFNWTPALEREGVETPYGLIFAMFMMACMCGASAFSLLGKNLPSIHVIFTTVTIACIALAFVTYALWWKPTFQLEAAFIGFLLFEFCVGVYFPSIGTFKSEVVAENVRATVYNIYRVPLNAVVCGLLLTDLPLEKAFRACAVLLCIAAACAAVMLKGAEKGKA